MATKKKPARAPPPAKKRKKKRGPAKNPMRVPSSVDDYLAQQAPPVRALLQQLRALIHKEAPGVVESVSYKIPTFHLNGELLIYIAGWAKHVSVYPVGRAVPATLLKVLAPHLAGPGTLKFSLGEPLPLDLITQFVRHRVRVSSP
jgi:uncharacterized protein YdhG (YjbR/CyaY superfamily)